MRVLIATDIAARGIDVDGISHVINFDFPPQPEDYVHRIGRTGRAQAIGDAISFVTHEDADSVQRLERFLGRGIARKKLEGYVAACRAGCSRRLRSDRAKGPWRSTNRANRARIDSAKRQAPRPSRPHEISGRDQFPQGAVRARRQVAP